MGQLQVQEPATSRLCSRKGLVLGGARGDMPTEYEVLARDVMKATNRLRADPGHFIALIEEDLKRFTNEKEMKFPDHVLQTTEGRGAWKEALEVLRDRVSQHATAPQLSWSDALALACVDHCRDTGPAGKTGHDGVDGSTMQTRIERYAEWGGQIGENIHYGGSATGDQIVKALFIDDGVPSRGHRENLLNHRFKRVGVACGPHSKFSHMCTMDFATECRDNGETSTPATASKIPAQAAPVEGNDEKLPACLEELKLIESTDNASALEPANWTGKSVKTNVEICEQNCDGVKTTTTTTKVETTFTFADGSTETRTSVTTETR